MVTPGNQCGGWCRWCLCVRLAPWLARLSRGPGLERAGQRRLRERYRSAQPRKAGSPGRQAPPAGEAQHPSWWPAPASTAGRAVRATWLMVAKGTGSTARSVGRAREIDPGHRRDGIALALLGVAVVIAASSWFDAARPVGAWVDSVVRMFLGSAVVVLPLVTAAVALLLMRTEPNPEARPRLVLGAAMVALPALGLWHLWAGSPDTPAGRATRRWFHRLRDRRSALRGADPVDLRAVAVHRRAVRPAAVDRHHYSRSARELRSMFGTRMFDYRERRDYYDDDEGRKDVAEDFSDGYYDDAAAYGDDEVAQAWPSSRRDRPTADENPTVPEPAAPRSRKRETKFPKAVPSRILWCSTGSSRAVYAAVAEPADRRRSAEEARRRQRPDGRRDQRRCCSQFKVDAAVTGAPAGRRSPVTRSNSAPASRWRRSPRCRRTSPTRWPPRASGCGADPGEVRGRYRGA